MIMKTRQFKENSQVLASGKGQFSTQIINMQESIPLSPQARTDCLKILLVNLSDPSLTRNSCSLLSPRSPRWSVTFINKTPTSGPATIGGSTIGCGSGPMPFKRILSPSSSARVMPSSPTEEFKLGFETLQLVCQEKKGSQTCPNSL